MKDLSPKEIAALQALAKIHLGNPSVFLNWVDADALVKAGLAENFGTGKYAITQKGLETLGPLHPKDNP